MFSKNEETLEEFGDIDTLIACPSPRLIKTHLDWDLLSRQLWTVKPKVNRNLHNLKFQGILRLGIDNRDPQSGWLSRGDIDY